MISDMTLPYRITLARDDSCCAWDCVRPAHHAALAQPEPQAPRSLPSARHRVFLQAGAQCSEPSWAQMLDGRQHRECPRLDLSVKQTPPRPLPAPPEQLVSRMPVVRGWTLA